MKGLSKYLIFYLKFQEMLRVKEWKIIWWKYRIPLRDVALVLISAMEAYYMDFEDFGGYTTFCNCHECMEARKGRKLYKTFEVTGGEFRGSIIPSCCISIIK